MSGGKSKSVTVGYRYYMGLHMGICMGPVDALLALKVGDRAAWSGSQAASGSITVSAPELFGGEEREGGVAGTLDVMMGEPAQVANSYLTSAQGGLQPAYRGFLGVVFRQGLVGCNNPYLKPWAFKVRRILQGWQGGAAAWYPEKAEITLSSGDKAANPAHIAYECISNAEWGMGYSAGQIDDDNFRAAADVFHAEGMGLCLKWTRQEQIEAFLQVVMDHAGAVLRQDKRTGLFVIKPIRGDYDVDALQLFDENNVLAVESYQRPSITEAVNELTIGYDDVTTGNAASITVQNLANITAQGGVVTTSKNYPGIATSDLAVRVAMRDLTVISTPLAKVRLKVNREAWDVLPGDVIKFAWAKLGITSLILRVLRVNGGSLTDGAIEIEAAEDMFGLPASGYAAQQPAGWTDPNTLPAPATNREVGEAGYYELQQAMTSTELAALAPETGYLSTLAARPSSDSIDYSIVTSPNGSGFTYGGTGAFCPTGTLVAAIGPTDTAITLENLLDADIVEEGGWAYLGDEIVRIDTFDASTGAATLGRGVLDTVATAHAAGTRLYFADGYTDGDNVERVDGETLHVKLLPSTGRGRLAEGSTTDDVVTFDQRAARPYPPGRLRINNLAYPAEIIDQPLTVSWAHRDRTQQNLEGDESGSIGPEAGMTYSVRLTNVATAAVIQAYTGLTGTSQALPAMTGSYTLKVELWSERDGLPSRQVHSHTFSYTNITRITTEAGDRIATEALDTITTE